MKPHRPCAVPPEFTTAMQRTAHATSWSVLGSVAAALIGSSPAWAECALTLNDTRVDFGVLQRYALGGQDAQVTLGERSLRLGLNCTSERTLTLHLRASAADSERFRLGDKGFYQVRLRDVLLDGAPVDLGEEGPQAQAAGRATPNAAWRPGRGLVPMRDGRIVQGKALQAQLDITATAPREALRVRDETLLHAVATLDVPDADVRRELSLSSTLMPVSCEPVLSGNGRVDFGRRSAGELNRSIETALPAQTVELTVACDGPAMIALRVLDNRAGTATLSTEGSFGLGLARGKQIGRYALRLEEARINGWPAVYATRSWSAGASWSVAQAPGVDLSTQAWLGFSASQGAVSGPDDLQHLSATVSVAPIIAPIGELDVNEAISLDGSSTIEILYL